MMSEEEVKRFLIERIETASKSCNPYFTNHVKGQIRAITAVLSGGEMINSDWLKDYLVEAEIPEGEWPALDEE